MPRLTCQSTSPVDVFAAKSNATSQQGWSAKVASVIQEARYATVEMTSLQAILTSGIAALQDSFRDLAEQIHAMTIAAAPTPERADSLDCKTLERIAVQDQATFARLSSELDRALQAVQFDDMATQLIGRVIERLGRIECGLDSGAAEPLAVAPLHSAADRPQQVTFGNETTTGDIELF